MFVHFLDWQPEQIDEYVEWLQRTPSITVVRVNTLRTTVDIVKKHILHVLHNDEYLTTCPAVEIVATLPEIVCIGSLDTSAYDCKPRPDAKEVIVDASCGAAILRGAHIFAPGVLAMQTNTKYDEMVNVYVDLDGCCKKGLSVVYESDAKLFVGIGVAKMQRFQLFGAEKLNGIAIRMIQTTSRVPSIGDGYLSDQFALLQNIPSIVCGRVVDPQPGEHILDMCAAPGNKTTHLAQLMHDTGSIIALDRSERRVAILRENVQRAELKCVQCFTFDATKAIANECSASINGGPPFRAESFDRILLDAPCSGFGNRPLLTSKMSLKALQSYPKLQKKLLDAAAVLVKPGGILVYSTCTVIPAENETNIAWFLEKFGNTFELIAAEPAFGRSGVPNAGLSETDCRKVQNFRPAIHTNDANCMDYDSTGFFICKLRKKTSIQSE